MATDWSAHLIYRAVMANATLVSSHISAQAQQGREEAIKAALEARHQEEQRIIDTRNAAVLAETTRYYGKLKSVSYKLSLAQLQDAKWKAQEYRLLADDFIASANIRAGQMSSGYSRSGALMAGSALARTAQTNEEGAKGAARLRRAADHAMRRGRMLASITRQSVIKPPFIPIPDAIKQTYVKPFVPDQPTGGGGGGGGFTYGGGLSGSFNFGDRAGTISVRSGVGHNQMSAFQLGGVFMTAEQAAQRGIPAPSGLVLDEFNFGGAGDEYGRRDQWGWDSNPNPGAASPPVSNVFTPGFGDSTMYGMIP